MLCKHAQESALHSARTGNEMLSAPIRPDDTAVYFSSGSFSSDWTVWVALYTYLQLTENIVPGNYTAGWEVSVVTHNGLQGPVGCVTNGHRC